MRSRPIDNSNGRVTAMTLVTGMPRWQIIRQRVVFGIVHRLPFLSKGLQRLAILQIGWWTILSRIPYNGPPQRRERLRSRYLFFEANFDDQWDTYIDAFGLKIPSNVDRMWGAGWTFPGARPTTNACSYVDDHQYPVDHFYAAYPEASTKMRIRALRLQERFEAFQAEASDLDDERFEAAYRQFVRASQADL